jgi:hypothetical protein
MTTEKQEQEQTAKVKCGPIGKLRAGSSTAPLTMRLWAASVGMMQFFGA